MRRMTNIIWLCCIAFFFSAIPDHAEELTAPPRVVDGDTLAFDQEKVRIEGVDIPESKQSCEQANGEGYPCGQIATEASKVRIGQDKCNVLCSLTEWLKEWQTLAAGVLALIAAVGAAWVAWLTLNYQRKESARLHSGRVRARKAFLPVDLQIFTEYLQECYEIAAKIRCARLYAERRDTINLHALETPCLPDRIMANMQTLIEHLDEDDASILLTVVQVYQIQNARFHDKLKQRDETWTTRITWLDFHETCRDVVFLHVLIGNIWPFARRKKEKIQPLKFSEEEVKNSILVLENGLSSTDLRIDPSREDKVQKEMFDDVVGAVNYYFGDDGPITNSDGEQMTS